MNYAEITAEVEKLFQKGSHHGAYLRIECSCLESQLEVIREIHNRKNVAYSAGDTIAAAYSESMIAISEEIEAKLKAMK